MARNPMTTVALTTATFESTEVDTDAVGAAA